jgi:hypothetical protein
MNFVIGKLFSGTMITPGVAAYGTFFPGFGADVKTDKYLQIFS